VRLGEVWLPSKAGLCFSLHSCLFLSCVLGMKLILFFSVYRRVTMVCDGTREPSPGYHKQIFAFPNAIVDAPA